MAGTLVLWENLNAAAGRAKLRVAMGDDAKSDSVESKAEAFLSEAYALDSGADAVAFYDRWADDYDTQVEHGLHYVAPGKIAAALARHQDPGDGAVLDVGCGTGLTGQCLAKLGLSVIDGIDLSAAMLAKAREKRIYRCLIEADLNAPLDLEAAGYAAVISSGTFTMGHVGPRPIDGLLRLITSGGYFACTVHAKVWDDMGFSAKFAALEDAGAVRRVEQYLSEYFAGGDKIAWYCVFQKV